MKRILNREFNLYKIIGEDYDLDEADDTSEENSDYFYILTNADIEQILKTVSRSDLLDYLEDNNYEYQVFWSEDVTKVRTKGK